MSLISLSFYVTPFEITPCHPQYAGVQGSHEAVEAVFELDERLYADSYLYRLEYMDGAGAGDTSDLLKPVFQESTGRYLIQSLLPDGWTQSGGGGTIRVVIARLNEIGHEEMVFYSLPARVYFSSREEDGARSRCDMDYPH